MKRTESTSYLLVRKLARRGNAEGYGTNRSRIYWYNSSDYSLWLLLRVDASKIKARHACPRWPCFVGYVCFIHTLTPLCSLLCRFSLPSPFYSLFQCSLFYCPVIVSCRLIVACYGGIAGPWATWSRQRKRELLFSSIHVRVAFSSLSSPVSQIRRTAEAAKARDTKLGYERIIVVVPNQHVLKRYAEACQRHGLEPTSVAKLLSCFHAKT